jgi:cytochrome b561
VILIPVLGWASASARGWPVVFFGMGNLPAVLPKGSPFGEELGDIHGFLSNLLLVLIGVHVAAALYHHFWIKDRVLLRMLPGARHSKGERF